MSESGRWPDLFDEIEAFVEAEGSSPMLGELERGFLSSVVKKCTEPFHRGHQAVLTIADRERKLAHHQGLQLAAGYASMIGDSLVALASRMLRLVKDKLLPNSETVESSVLYLRLQGDLWRYMYRVQGGEEAAQEALSASKAACLVAEDLAWVETERLEAENNYALTLFEISASPADALARVQLAYTTACRKLDMLRPDAYTQCAQKLRILELNIEKFSREVKQAQMFV